MGDPLPLYAIAAGIGWFSLITVEFYERIYRDKIERNLDGLRKMGEDDLRKLISEIEAATRQGISVDSKAVDKRLGGIRSLFKAQDVLVRYRKYLLIFLILSIMIWLVASYDPSLRLYQTELGPVTVTHSGYASLAIVFLGGFLFLNKMLWFDSQILTISRQAFKEKGLPEAEPKERALPEPKPRTLRLKKKEEAGKGIVEYEEKQDEPQTGVAAYRFPDAGLILVDWSKKAVYTLWDKRTYDAVESGRIKITMMGDRKFLDFFGDKQLDVFTRAPTKQELSL